MKKIVVKLNSVDNKQNPMQAVSSIQGIVLMELNAKDSKITIVGDVDPVLVVKKLRKWYAKLETVGPAKEEKPPAPAPATGGGKKEDDKKAPTEQEQMAIYLQNYRNYNPHYTQPYFVQSCEENPNACVIC